MLAPVWVAPVLALAICVAYAACLWWLLRRESAAAMAGVVALSGVALALRIWYTNDFPAGLIEDEPKMLSCAGQALKDGRLYNGECVGMPLLFWTLFQAQLVALVGPTRWAARSFSLVTSVLSVPAAYAVGRGLRLAVASSLVIGALVACLPWGIFFGRIALGGELVFHQLLLLGALVRCLGGIASWPDMLVGGIGLCGLLYDYFCGRAMAPLTLIAAVLARGRYRLFCVAMLVLALIGWAPYATGNAPSAMLGFSMTQSRSGMEADPITTVLRSTVATFRGLVPPASGRDSWFTIRSASLHPWWLLAVAVLGSLTGVRRGLFLWAAFLGGLAPSVVSEGQFPSGHRMLMAFPVIAIAVGCAVEVVPTRVLRTAAAVTIAVVASVWGVRFYFSPEFWPSESRWVFGTDRTDVVEAIPAPPHARLVVMKQLGYYFGPITLVDDSAEMLTVDNWVPKDLIPATYVFDPVAAPLRPFYERLVGPERVQTFGRAFIVSFEAGQWSWIGQHGWTYEVRCGTTVRQAVVPTLCHVRFSFGDFLCNEPVTHTWRGRWKGAATLLRLYVNGDGLVETSRGIVRKPSGEWAASDFPVQPGDEIRVTVVTPPPDAATVVALMEVTDATERLPVWESADPIVVSTDDGPLTPALSFASADRPPPDSPSP